MIRKTYETLEFNKVLDILAEHALSDKAKLKIRQLEPLLSEAEVSRHLNETTEGKLMMEHCGTPPLSAMNDIEKSLSLLGKGTFLLPEQLGSIAQFLTACRRLKLYLKKAESTNATVASYGNSIYALSEVEDEINRSVRGELLDDKASPQLANIRRKIANTGEQVKLKLDALLRNNKIWFSEGFISVRNGHYTLPVKREYKNQIGGLVIDVSQSGSTCFIEPSSVKKLQEEIGLLHIEEENEIRRILYTLTTLVEDCQPFININIEAMASLDFIFAKAKLSIAMKAAPLPVYSQRKMVLKAARHPLLKSDNVVPLDFHIGGDIKGVVITGPNTGGKTVVLKTIGLLSLMAQCGLHVPAAGGSFTMNNYVLCDIGDGQSITENLSTFSSHISNIIQILRLANEQSMILLDELGSGTDPAEGMGLAVAILEELAGKNCLFVATTHYPELKEYAKSTFGLINARMAFDRKSLMPLYKLEIGEAGESCALFIAKRLGLPQHMVERASQAAYGNNTDNYPDVYSEDPDYSEDVDYNSQYSRRVQRQEGKKAPDNSHIMKFNIGDSVMVYPQKAIGIVYQEANEKGEIGVQVKKDKLLVNHKRLKPYLSANDLYPENYDFSIIFDTVENRKKRHAMERKHDPKLIIETNNEKRG